MAGKGSNPRPFSVDRKTFDDNWDRIFNKKSAQDVKEVSRSIKEKQQEKNNDKKN